MSSTARPYQTAHAQMENSRSRTCASEQSKDAIENALRELRQMGQALEEDFEAANGIALPLTACGSSSHLHSSLAVLLSSLIFMCT